MENIKEAVRRVRDIRTAHNVAPSRKAEIFVVSPDEKVLEHFREAREFFGPLAHAADVILQRDKSGIADDAFSAALPGATLYIPFADLVDIGKEIDRLKKEMERLAKEVARSKGMLSNERFISKAPAEKVQAEKEKFAKYKEEADQVKQSLEELLKKQK